MTYVQISIPYTTKSQSGVEYTHYKKVYIDKDKAIEYLKKEEAEKQKNDIKMKHLARNRKR